MTNVTGKMFEFTQRFGSSVSYPQPPQKQDFTMNVCVFADAGRQCDHGQLSYVCGLLLGPLEKGSTFYTLSWMSQNSRRTVKYVAAAEIVAVGEAIDEGKMAKFALQDMLKIDVHLIVVTDSKDLYNSLSTQRNATDRSVRADVNVIRFDFETKAVDQLVWIPGRTNLADPGTKRDSTLSEALQLLLYTGKIPIDLSEAEVRSSNRPLG